MDDQTPQTAIVEAEVQGQLPRIDFLGNVLGVRPKALLDNVAEIIVPYAKEDTAGHLAIR